MPYSPPNTFTTKLVASEFSGNSDALRVYLHEGIPTGDIAAADQFDTRHIVGPPLYDPTSGIQHGVTGHQGGLVSTSSLTRLTFTSQSINGGDGNYWAPIPLISLRIEVRRRSDVILNWWAECISGPDDRPFSGFTAIRTSWISFWSQQPDFTEKSRSSLHPTNVHGFEAASPHEVAPDLPWELSGWNDAEGCAVLYKWADNALAPITCGLSAFGQIRRVAVLNFGVTIESYT